MTAKKILGIILLFTLLLTLTTFVSADLDLTDGLVACYDFENDGDDNYNSLDLTITNANYTNSNATGYALGFNGAGSTFAQIADSNDAFDNTDELTVRFIMSMDHNGATQRIFHKSGSWDLRGDVQWDDELRDTVTTTASNSHSGVNGAIGDGVEAEWVFVYYEDFHGHWKNTVQNSNETGGDAGSTIADTSGDLYIGIDVNEASYPMQGYIDEIAIYNKAHNQTFIEAIEGLNCTEILATGSGPQTDFYFAQDGDDANDCTITEPCQTITKLNTLSLQAGNTVHFNGEDIWYLPDDDWIDFQSGNAGGYISYTSYGTGAAELRGSINASNTSLWSVYSGNVYEFEGTIVDIGTYTGIGNVIYNNGPTGYREWSTGDLNSQGEWYYDVTNDVMYIYSTSNPATYYDTIDLAYNDNIINIRQPSWPNAGVEYINITNLQVKNGARHGIYINYGTNHVLINNVNISTIGGGYWASGPSRWGNGAEVFQNASHISYTNMVIDSVWDAGITTQSNSVTYFNNITFRNITVLNSTYCYELFSNDAGNEMNNIVYDHITCLNTGTFWGGVEREETIEGIGPVAGRFGQMLGTASNISFTNIIHNVDYNNWGYGYELAKRGKLMSTSWVNALTTDYSLYYIPNTPAFRWQDTGPSEINYNTLASYVSATGLDTHSAWEYVEVVDWENGDYRPVYDSGACGSASDGGDIGAWPCQESGGYFTVTRNNGNGLTFTFDNGTILTNTTGNTITTEIGKVETDRTESFTLTSTDNVFSRTVTDWNTSTDYSFDFEYYYYLEAENAETSTPITNFIVTVTIGGTPTNYTSNATGQAVIPNVNNTALLVTDFYATGYMNDFNSISDTILSDTSNTIEAYDYLEITTYDVRNLTPVLDFNVTVNGQVYESNGAGIATIEETGTYSYTITSDTHLTKTDTHNFVGNNDLNVSLRPSIIKFVAREFLTNAQITGGVFNVNGTEANTQFLPPGTYNVTFALSPYYNKTEEFTVSQKDDKTVTIYNITNSYTNINFYHWYTNASVNASYTISSYGTTATGVGTHANVSTYNNTNFTIVATATGFVNTIGSFIGAVGYTEMNFVLNEAALWLNFTETTNGTITALNYSTTFEDITQYVKLSQFSNGTVVLSWNNDTQKAEYYNDGESYWQLNMHVENREIDPARNFISYHDGQVVENAFVTAEIYYNGGWKLFQSRLSDVQGRSNMQFVGYEEYKICSRYEDGLTCIILPITPTDDDIIEIKTISGQDIISNLYANVIEETDNETTYSYRYVCSSPSCNIQIMTTYNYTNETVNDETESKTGLHYIDWTKTYSANDIYDVTLEVTEIGGETKTVHHKLRRFNPWTISDIREVVRPYTILAVVLIFISSIFIYELARKKIDKKYAVWYMTGYYALFGIIIPLLIIPFILTILIKVSITIVKKVSNY